MIPSGVENYVALEPVDMRLSFDRLAGLAKEQTGYDARSGALFIFFGRRRDALKVLFFDGSGMRPFISVSIARRSRSLREWLSS
jgi:transposase